VLVENAQSEVSDLKRKLQEEMEKKEKAVISLQVCTYICAYAG
jgi:hypothetical protein